MLAHTSMCRHEQIHGIAHAYVVYLQIQMYHEDTDEILGLDPQDVHDLQDDNSTCFSTTYTENSDTEGAGVDSEDEFPEVVPSLRRKPPLPLSEIEKLTNVSWVAGGKIDEPQDKFSHGSPGGSDDDIRIKSECTEFLKTPMQSFLAFLPLDFWSDVLLKTNNCASEFAAADKKVGGGEIYDTIHVGRIDEDAGDVGRDVMRASG